MELPVTSSSPFISVVAEKTHRCLRAGFSMTCVHLQMDRHCSRNSARRKATRPNGLSSYFQSGRNYSMSQLMMRALSVRSPSRKRPASEGQTYFGTKISTEQDFHDKSQDERADVRWAGRVAICVKAGRVTMRKRQSFATILVGKSILLREGLARILRSANFRILASVSCADDLLASKLQLHQPLFIVVHTGDDFDAALEQIELLRDQHPGGRIATVAAHYRLTELVSA